MNIVIHYMNSHEAANDVARRCMALGSKVLTVTADMKDRSQLVRMAEKLESSGMQPDILVNNAGKAHYGMLADVTEEEWDDIMAVNLKGTFCAARFLCLIWSASGMGGLLMSPPFGASQALPARLPTPPARVG